MAGVHSRAADRVRECTGTIPQVVSGNISDAGLNRRLQVHVARAGHTIQCRTSSSSSIPQVSSANPTQPQIMPCRPQALISGTQQRRGAAVGQAMAGRRRRLPPVTQGHGLDVSR